MIFVIHTCPKRIWYVNEYLIPSLKKQGVLDNDIYVYNDVNGDGNLVSCMKSYLYFSGAFPKERNIWHLQDDIIIARNFYERCHVLSSGNWDVVMGYSGECEPEKHDKSFPTAKEHLWWSAPCMKMTAENMGLVSDRFWKVMPGDKKYLLYYTLKKCDDVIINDWIAENLKGMRIVQVSPSLVDHVDFLLGGSIVNATRKNIARSKDFVDRDLIDILKSDLIKKGRLK